MKSSDNLPFTKMVSHLILHSYFSNVISYSNILNGSQYSRHDRRRYCLFEVVREHIRKLETYVEEMASGDTISGSVNIQKVQDNLFKTLVSHETPAGN